jgi:hypothetical protein
MPLNFRSSSQPAQVRTPFSMVGTLSLQALVPPLGDSSSAMSSGRAPISAPARAAVTGPFQPRHCASAAIGRPSSSACAAITMWK